jgi:hypothetical protein
VCITSVCDFVFSVFENSILQFLMQLQEISTENLRCYTEGKLKCFEDINN